jgi:hypothetical protein
MRTTSPGFAAASLLVAVLAFCPAKSLSQVALEEAGSIFERSLSCGQALFSEQEIASLIESAVSYFPAITSNPRIAGTAGRVSRGTINGYYGGIVIGPINQGDRRADYYYFSVSGDLNRGWTLDVYQRDTIVLQDQGPAYLLLIDGDLEDDFEVTETQAQKVLAAELSRNSQVAMRNQLHRYQYAFSNLPDVSIHRKQAMNGPLSWAYNHYHIIAYSQELGSHPSVYNAIYNYAVIDGELHFVSESPGYNLFEQPGVERDECPQ